MRHMNKTDVLHLRLHPDLVAEINAYAQTMGEDNTSAACRTLLRLGLRTAKPNANAQQKEANDETAAILGV
jgi:hypothetical protein